MKSSEELDNQFSLEDLIINDFIAKDMSFTSFYNEKDKSIPYNSLQITEQNKENNKAFSFYNERYLQYMEDEDVVKLTFENFVLSDNPRDEFQTDLLDMTLGNEVTPAYEFEKLYTSDLELHKKAALKGYQTNLLKVGQSIA